MKLTTLVSVALLALSVAAQNSGPNGKRTCIGGAHLLRVPEGSLRQLLQRLPGGRPQRYPQLYRPFLLMSRGPG
ncbi:hydrolase [Ascochyta rabiei]|uniref:Hydrolase n=1 Tax=Didymella rabiei TaxID=5454 RepID=A0A163KVY9_DIDRA|nr:hydrolase [Ascochyta rabiei]